MGKGIYSKWFLAKNRLFFREWSWFKKKISSTFIYIRFRLLKYWYKWKQNEYSHNEIDTQRHYLAFKGSLVKIIFEKMLFLTLSSAYLHSIYVRPLSRKSVWFG